MALLAVPTEVLEHIAFHLVLLDPLGPPTSLKPLRATCKKIYLALAPANNAALYARIFKACFDTSSVERRLFDPKNTQFVDQLWSYCRILEFFRGQPGQPLANLHHSDAETMLLHAMLILQESDGKNHAQLEWAGLYNFAQEFVRQRLWEDSAAWDGWPTECVGNTCALWVLWMMSTRERLLGETDRERQDIIELVLPYIVLPFRYSSTKAPVLHYNLPLSPVRSVDGRRHLYAVPHSVQTNHGPYPAYPIDELTYNVPLYSSRTPLSPPSITTAAKLLFVSRKELIDLGIPPHLPRTRADAVARSVATQTPMEICPTQEDMQEFSSSKGAKLVPRTKWDWWTETTIPPSVKWDDDFFRSRYCYNVFLECGRRNGKVFTPGILDGLWQGRMIYLGENRFMELLESPRRPANFNEAALNPMTVPLYMRLREYHFVAASSRPRGIQENDQPVPHGRRDGPDDGVRNAWFPDDTTFERVNGGLNVYTRSSSQSFRPSPPTFYERYTPSRPNSHDPYACDECIKRQEEEAILRQVFNQHSQEGEDGEETLWRSVGLGRALKREEGRYGAGLDYNQVATEYGDVEMGDGVGEDGMDDTDGEDETEGDEIESEMITEEDLPLDDPRKAPPCRGIRDIIVEGETDLRHGQAWNHFVYRGRVRPWDGLVGILRVARDRQLGLGDIFFYGYIVGRQNFVGNWRMAMADTFAPSWEGTFCLSKRDEQ